MQRKRSCAETWRPPATSKRKLHRSMAPFPAGAEGRWQWDPGGDDRGLGCCIGSGLAGGGGQSPARTHSGGGFEGGKYQLHLNGWGWGDGGRRSCLWKQPLPVLAFSREARRGGRRGHSGLGGGHPQPLIEVYVLGAGSSQATASRPGSRLGGQPSLGHRTPVGRAGLSQGPGGLGAAASLHNSPKPRFCPSLLGHVPTA